VDGDGQLKADLAAIGATVIDADGPATAARAVGSASSTGRVALVDRRLVAHRHALRLAIDDPRWVASHAPGVLAVSGEARGLLVDRLRAMPDLTGHRVEGFSPAAKLTAPRPLVPDQLAEQLGADLPLHQIRLPDGLIAELVAEPLAARKAAYADVAAVDDEAIRLRRAVKNDDGLFTTFFVSTYSRYIARWCARRDLSPNTVTVLSLLVAVAGAITAATGTRAGYIAAAVALYLSFVLDCTDGQLARYALKFSRIGSWLDATFDRVKEYAVYAGLAFGSARNGTDVWLLAAVAMALQTVRHHIDFAFHEAQQGDAAAAQSDPNPQPARSPGYWARKVIILPIGERWALIALLTAFTEPKITFVVLLIWGVLATAYTTAGRVQRALRWTTPRTPEAVAALFAMSDIAAAPKAERTRLGARLGWLTPPVYHVLEYALAIAIASQVHNALPIVFAYLGAVIYHHYDVVYRIRAHAAAPRWLTLAGCLAFEGRVVILALSGLILGGSRHPLLVPVLICAAVYLGVLFVGESVRFWSRPAAPVLPADAA
jgi:phosphatidylglycerophosphate synthase